MPDITMCKDSDCEQHKDCYRFTAKPSEIQSYFVTTPRDGKGCEYFWSNNERESKENN